MSSATAFSVVICARNEERNLPFALRSVTPFTADIVVIDVKSEDRTSEIALSFGAKVIPYPTVSPAEPIRPLGVAAAKNEWILVLDADELITPRLGRRLQEIASSDLADAVLIPRRNYLFGGRVHYSGYSLMQDCQLRFFKRSLVRLPAEVHRPYQPAPEARVFVIREHERCDMVHFPYVNLSHYIEKLNRYTSQEVDALGAHPQKQSYALALWKALREFLLRYFRQRGCLDGWRGFYIACFMAFYRLAVQAKSTELSEVGTDENVLALYAREAERLLQETP